MFLKKMLDFIHSDEKEILLENFTREELTYFMGAIFEVDKSYHSMLFNFDFKVTCFDIEKEEFLEKETFFTFNFEINKVEKEIIKYVRESTSEQYDSDSAIYWDIENDLCDDLSDPDTKINLKITKI